MASLTIQGLSSNVILYTNHTPIISSVLPCFLNILAPLISLPIILCSKVITHSLRYSTVYLAMATPNGSNLFFSIIECGTPHSVGIFFPFYWEPIRKGGEGKQLNIMAQRKRKCCSCRGTLLSELSLYLKEKLLYLHHSFLCFITC